VRFVITVDALKEGWDCSWAYVLCSVAEMKSDTAVEQLIGRVLRLPGARRKDQRPNSIAPTRWRPRSNFAATARALGGCAGRGQWLQSAGGEGSHRDSGWGTGEAGVAGQPSRRRRKSLQVAEVPDTKAVGTGVEVPR
jgi:hypothetical protein